MQNETTTENIEERKEIESHLSDRYWRLNNLYYITNEHGQKVLFQFNWFQEILFRTLHYLNIILKARQVGITTFFCIVYLDDILFNDNLKAAIIADTRDHAQKIFQEKIKHPFDNLPEWLRSEYKANTDTAQQLSFTNNSSIEVATSVRSGTYQRLHITEFAKISAKTPEKAREIVTGSLNTVHKGEYVSIESTAEGAFGYFYDFFQTAETNRKSNQTLTELDYKPFFFPWWEVPTYRLAGNYLLPESLIKYYGDVELKLGITIDQQQRNWYWKKSVQQGDDMRREYPSYPEEAFQAATEGSIYGKQIDKARSDGRIRFVPHDPQLPVDTWWDLGRNDNNVILFTQTVAKEIRLIHTYVNNNEGLEHYLTYLAKMRDESNYRYRKHTFPHDIKVKELSTNKSRWEFLIASGMSEQTMRYIPLDLSLQDGIDATKRIFSRLFIDEKLDQFIKACALYRREWDDKLGVFKSEPVHDEYSHIMDALRTLAVGMIDEISYDRNSSIQPQEEAMQGDERYQIAGLID